MTLTLPDIGSAEFLDPDKSLALDALLEGPATSREDQAIALRAANLPETLGQPIVIATKRLVN